MNESYADHQVRSCQVKVVSVAKQHVHLTFEDHDITHVEFSNSLAAPFLHWPAWTS